MKAPFSIVNRLAEQIFVRELGVNVSRAPMPESEEQKVRDMAALCFRAAEIFGEESERRFQEARASTDTERAKRVLDEANKR